LKGKTGNMPTDIEILESLDLFKGLKTNALELITKLVHPLRITEGEVITRRNEPATTFYMVLSGNFMIYFAENQAITLHNRGDIMGWATLVSPFYYNATTIALTDGEVLTLDGQAFLRLIEENATIGEKIMKKIEMIIENRRPMIKS
jgi:CRP-like cAMP-binding protein